jgi:ERI1 exoribonuclease 3
MTLRKPQPFQYFLVLDFEATCEDGDRNYLNEIIEFPTVVLNSETLQNETEFHKYVKPTVNKQLTKFCQELTGIKQEWVDNGEPSLQKCMEAYHEWMMQQGFIKNDTEYGDKSFAFVTCGDWDLKTMIRGQCKREGIKLPFYFDKWCNLKHAYQEFYHEQAFGMSNMLEKLGLELKGKHHSGIDDCRNIAQVAKAMIEQGAILKLTVDGANAIFDDGQTFKAEFVDIPGTSSSFAVSIKPPRDSLESLCPTHKVTHMVSVLHPSKEGGKKFHNIVSQKLKDLTHIDVQAKVKPLFAGEVDVAQFAKIVDAVKNEQSRLLIHCNDTVPPKASAMNSTLYTYALIRRVTGLPRDECISMIKKSRWRHAEKIVEEHSANLNQVDQFIANL